MRRIPLLVIGYHVSFFFSFPFFPETCHCVSSLGFTVSLIYWFHNTRSTSSYSLSTLVEHKYTSIDSSHSLYVEIFYTVWPEQRRRAKAEAIASKANKKENEEYTILGSYKNFLGIAEFGTGEKEYWSFQKNVRYIRYEIAWIFV